MRKKNGLLVFVSWFLLLAAIMASSIMPIAAQRTVGVHVGDWFEYGNVEFNWTSSDPSEEPPPEWIAMSEAEWMKTTVQEISGTNITGQMIIHYKNGTEHAEGYWIDVETGHGNGTMLFIAANLAEGDLIYTDPSPDSPFQGATINETISREYLGETVDVNHLNITQEITMPEVFYSFMSFNFYWYKSTGAVAEFAVSYHLKSEFLEYETSFSVSAVIADMIPEFPTWTSILLILTVITFVAFIYKRRITNKTPF